MEEIKVGMSTKEFIENLEVFNNTGEHIDNPKVGDYIRTIDGYIRRIAKVNTERKAITYSGTYILDKPYKNSQSVARNKIIKFSQDITELIEPYDLYEVATGDNVICNYHMFYNLEALKQDIDLIKHYKNKITAILTKQQREDMEYRLED